MKKNEKKNYGDPDDEVCVCGHTRFFHRLIFEATGKIGRCHFVECQCPEFRKKGEEE